jgi:hypothetical protein
LKAQSESEYFSFKCGRDVFMCGGLKEGQVCQNFGTERNGAYLTATQDECKGMIKATATIDAFKYRCPNLNAISHYVEYGLDELKEGTKYELDANLVIKTSRCSCRATSGCGVPKTCGEGYVKEGKYEMLNFVIQIFD